MIALQLFRKRQRLLALKDRAIRVRRQETRSALMIQSDHRGRLGMVADIPFGWISQAGFCVFRESQVRADPLL